MNASDLLPFDLAIIPWPTHISDWALCLTADPEGRVWVEHRLIRVILEAIHRENSIYYIRETLVQIGSKIAKVVECLPEPLEDGHVRAVKFNNHPLDMRIGQFGGEIFVFLPKPEFEQ